MIFLWDKATKRESSLFNKESNFKTCFQKRAINKKCHDFPVPAVFHAAPLLCPSSSCWLLIAPTCAAADINSCSVRHRLSSSWSQPSIVSCPTYCFAHESLFLTDHHLWLLPVYSTLWAPLSLDLFCLLCLFCCLLRLFPRPWSFGLRALRNEWVC